MKLALVILATLAAFILVSFYFRNNCAALGEDFTNYPSDPEPIGKGRTQRTTARVYRDWTGKCFAELRHELRGEFSTKVVTFETIPLPYVPPPTSIQIGR